TLQSVADHLGVSRTTVSNAYNRPDQLSAELRARVLAAAAELGYHGPDAAARQLRRGRTGTLGVVLTSRLSDALVDADSALLLRGAAVALEEAAARGAGAGAHALALVPVPPDTDGARAAVSSVAVDGWLLYSLPDDHPAVTAVVERGQPVVVVDEPDLGAGVSFVGVDDRTGARLAAEHLVELGHRHLGIVTLPLATRAVPGPVAPARLARPRLRILRERLAGWFEVLDAAGIADVPVWEAAANHPDAGREAATALLAAHPELTAVLAASDQLAIGVTQAALRAGVAVPDELSVVGFDDVPRAARWDPPLTTVRQPLADKGRAAVELLLAEPRRPGSADRTDAASGQTRHRTSRRIEFPVELVVRASTAPPRRP
ncbi:MAG: LacI family DNA-binding transcriptional regulator, partial [Actinomyces sp.]